MPNYINNKRSLATNLYSYSTTAVFLDIHVFWPCAWFLEIALVRVLVCVCLSVCLCVRP